MEFRVEANVITKFYEELHGSPSLDFNGESTVLTRKLKCKWKDRMILARDLLGWTWYDGTFMIYRIPHSYRPFNAGAVLYASEISSMQGFAGLVSSPRFTTVAEYEEATLIVKYTVPDYNYSTPPIVSERFEPASEFITLNHENLFWDAGQVEAISELEAPGHLVKMFDWVYTMHVLSFIHPDLINAIGTVNGIPVYSNSLDAWFAPETLLYGNPVIEREYTVNALRNPWRITIRLTFRDSGWNTFPKPSTTSGALDWSYIYNNAGYVIRPYPLADWTGVLF